VRANKEISTLVTVSDPGLFGLQNNIYTRNNLIDNDLYMIPFFFIFFLITYYFT